MKNENSIIQKTDAYSVKSVVLSELDTNAQHGKKFLDGNFSLISDLKVKIEALVGTTELTVKELFDLKMGSVVELNQSIDTLLTLKLDDKIIAFGSLVVVGDNFGIKIAEVVEAKSSN